MTYKIAMTGLSARGAKSVVFGDPRRDKTPELLAAFAGAVNRLGGNYHCGGDVGISSADMEVIRQHTAHTPAADLGDLAVPTAQGVFEAIRAAAKHVLGGGAQGARPLEGVHVAVQGVGEVGRRLCNLLHADGARLTVADVNQAAVEAVVQSLGAEQVHPSDILQVPAEIVSPCALGAVLNGDTARQIKARIVCGAANNQLASPEVAEVLSARGVTYVPDFVANAGGVLGGLRKDRSADGERDLQERLQGIGEAVPQILELALTARISTHAAAELRARQIMGEI